MKKGPDLKSISVHSSSTDHLPPDIPDLVDLLCNSLHISGIDLHPPDLPDLLEFEHQAQKKVPNYLFFQDIPSLPPDLFGIMKMQALVGWILVNIVMWLLGVVSG